MFPPEKYRAFTLLELLVAISIISILMAAAAPSLPNLVRASGVNQAVSDIPAILEEARAYAMGHNTYVWVGFYPDATANRLSVGVVAGNTGQSDDLTSTAYGPISKLRSFENFSLKSISGLSGMATSADEITDSNIGSFSQGSGGRKITFTHIIEYTPQGMAAILSNTTSRWIQIGVQPTGKTDDPNIAVFQLATLTGQVRVFRP